MAQKIDNDKGFLILSVDKTDMDKINSPGICDWCSDLMEKGKYIAVLNHIYCDQCYNDWMIGTKYFSQDKYIEEKNYKHYYERFNS